MLIRYVRDMAEAVVLINSFEVEAATGLAGYRPHPALYPAVRS